MAVRRRDFLFALGAGISTAPSTSFGQGRPLAPGDVRSPGKPAWDNGAMWIVDGVDEPRLVKTDLKNGVTLESIQMIAGEPDPHGLAMLNGKLYFCDAGIHPGWERDRSPHTGWVCRVDVV
jgi:hypothetical protein